MGYNKLNPLEKEVLIKLYRRNPDVKMSEFCAANNVRRAFGCLGISAQTRHKAKKYERKVKDPYPNLVFSVWETVDRPRQVIVSDMTAFKCRW